MIKKIDGFLKKYSFLSIITAYFLISLLFNYPVFWGELLHDSSKDSAIIGEIAATEWGMEQSYKRMLQFENPFSTLESVFYPFGIDVSGGDIGFSFHFLYLRPFLSPHQSLFFLVILNFFLANICMYAFLRKIGIGKLTAFLIGLAYGYMTFMTVRMGHLTYSLYYVFPLFYLSLAHFLTAKRAKRKLIFTGTTSFLFVVTFLQHIYYFIMLFISLITLGLYYLITDRKKSLQIFRDNFMYFAAGIFLIIILLIPWFSALSETVIFSEPPQSIGWGGAVGFSSDLLGFFIPSSYNYYYGKFVDAVIQKLDIIFAKGIFENYTYPGIIILMGYVYLVTLLFRKKPAKIFWKKFEGFFVTSIFFVILTLGPFLHVGGKWAFELKEGIKLVVPLPYALLHYIPFLGNIRSPGRFIVAAIFFGYIVVAFLLSDYLKNKSKKFIYCFAVLFIAIFIVDHRFPATKLSVPFYFPINIYRTIAKDTSNSTVMEIPFTVRDGITYFGDEGAIYQIMGQFLFDKPILGGYTGRVPDYIKNYYKKNALLGYLGRKIDENILGNGGIDKQEVTKWQKLNTEEASRAADFLSLKHIILNTDKSYAATLAAELSELGFKKTQTDRNYILMERPVSNKEFLSIDMSRSTDSLLLGMGWSNPQNKLFRFADKRSSALFRIVTPRNFTLEFAAESAQKGNSVTVYVNKEKVSTLILYPSKKTYKVPIPFILNQGINTFHFIFDETTLVNPTRTSTDNSKEISAKFYSIRLIQ